MILWLSRSKDVHNVGFLPEQTRASVFDTIP